jgi:hypothetical protein
VTLSRSALRRSRLGAGASDGVTAGASVMFAGASAEVCKSKAAAGCDVAADCFAVISFNGSVSVLT